MVTTAAAIDSQAKRVREMGWFEVFSMCVESP